LLILTQRNQGQVLAQAAGPVEDVDEQDGLLAPAAPHLGVEVFDRKQAQLAAVFGALGQGVAVPGQVLGLEALVQVFEGGNRHKATPKIRPQGCAATG
jgi:hypothetical protein